VGVSVIWPISFAALVAVILYMAFTSEAHPPDPDCANVGCTEGSTDPCCPGWSYDYKVTIVDDGPRWTNPPELEAELQALRERIEKLEREAVTCDRFESQWTGAYWECRNKAMRDESGADEEGGGDG